MSETFLGRIKWFNGSRGYGFVTNVRNGDDTFLHHTGITVKENCWKTLFPGEYVSYEVTVDDSGKSNAVNVTGVEGGPLLCETRSILNRERDGNRPRRSRNSRRQQEGTTTAAEAATEE